VNEPNNRLGILLMVATTFVFAIQARISRPLASAYNVQMVVMYRYWFFVLFVVLWTARKPGGLQAALRTTQPVLQIFRGTLLAAEICVMVFAYTRIGLINSLSVFNVYPLLIVALSGPVLGEKVGWRRWSAVAVGFIGVLVILRPGAGVFSPEALIPLVSASMFALYGLLTRMAARKDNSGVSFFWTGVSGFVVMTVYGIWYIVPMSPGDWAWMGLLCITGASGHWLLIRVYEVAEASAVQPFAYLQFVFVSIVGITIFGEVMEPETAFGAALIISAGVFTFIRQRAKKVPVQIAQDSNI